MKYYNMSLVRSNKVVLVFLLIGWMTLAFGQVPAGLNYQSIVRDQAGKPLPSKSVSIKFSILKGSSNGTLVYAEEHHSVTNAFGLTNVYIGFGFPLQGNFEQVPWSEGSLYLKVEMDPNGGSNYELSSVSPFLSVPYALYAKNTSLEAGPGISISGNRISNTGDPDPNDDLKAGSPVSGDLEGALPGPAVIGLRGRPIAPVPPGNEQVLVWNGTYWAPVSVDIDPTNDLLINSPATGDLRGSYPGPIVQGLQGRPIQNVAPSSQQALVWSGTQWTPATVDVDPANDVTTGTLASGDLSGNYPGPKLVKINGFPLDASTPDSGDVMIFLNGQWTFRPMSSSGGESFWKMAGTELKIKDPVSIKKVNLENTVLCSSNEMITMAGLDSSKLLGAALFQSQFDGTSRWRNAITPGKFNVFAGNTQTMGLNSGRTGGNQPYSELFFNDADPGSPAVYGIMDAGGIGFESTNPMSQSFFTASSFDINHVAKQNPLQYSGLFVTDSLLQLYTFNNVNVHLESNSLYGGGLYLTDRFGKDRVWISYLEQDATQGYITVLSGKTNREAASLLSSNSAGEMVLSNSTTNKVNVYAGYSNIGVNYPFIGVIGTDNNDHAGMFIDQFNDGYVFADVKTFRMQDPRSNDREIWYACIEGPEAAAYERGISQLQNGEKFVAYSEHFLTVANTQDVTILLTPSSIHTYGLAVVEKRKDGFVVKELQGGTGNFSFDWEVKAVRNGKEHFQVYRNKQMLRNSEVKHNAANRPTTMSREFAKSHEDLKRN